MKIHIPNDSGEVSIFGVITNYSLDFNIQKILQTKISMHLTLMLCECSSQHAQNLFLKVKVWLCVAFTEGWCFFLLICIQAVYLNLHIAEQRPTVQQLVVLPAPAHLPHVAPPGHGRGGGGCSSAQVTEVARGLRWRRAHPDMQGEIIWSGPVVSNSIWTFFFLETGGHLREEEEEDTKIKY